MDNKFFKTLNLLFLFLAMHSSFAANRYWIGNGSNKNWNTTSNWSATSGGSGGASVPGASDDVFFDNGGTGQLILDVNISMKVLTVATGYTDTIKQNGKTISTTGWSFSGGTFQGNTAPVTILGNCTIAGGTFISTAAALIVSGTFNHSGGSFLHNNGIVRFSGTASPSAQSISGSTNFYDLLLQPSTANTVYTFDASSVFNVSHLLTESGAYIITINSGTINVQGDVTQLGTSPNPVATGTIQFNGNSNQTINGATGANALNQSGFCNVKINKTGGVLYLKNYVNVAGKWERIQGMVDDITYDAEMSFNTGGTNTIIGSQKFNKLWIGTYGGINNNFTVNANDTLTVGWLHTGVNGAINYYGYINITGDFWLGSSNTTGGGTGTITFTGSGNQLLTGQTLTYSQGILPNIKIDKPSGTLTLKNIISVRGNWQYVRGTIDATTENSTIYFLNGNRTISGKHKLNHVYFSASAATTNTIPATDTLTVQGTLTTTGNNSLLLNTGVVKVTGDITVTNTYGLNTPATGTILIAGSGNQTYTGSTNKNQGWLYNIVIDKPAGVLTLKNYINTLGNWTYRRGTIDAQTYNSTVVFGYNLTLGNITGNHSLYNVIFSAYIDGAFSIPNGNELTVLGTLSFEGNYAITMYNGIIHAKGNVSSSYAYVDGSTIYYSGGSTVIDICGTTDQTLTGHTAIGTGKFPSITINKPSGTLFLKNYISVNGNWNYISGTIDGATYDATVVFGKSLGRTISGKQTFHKLLFNGENTSVLNTIASTDTITVSGELKIIGNNGTTLSDGVFRVTGDLTNLHPNAGGAGNATFYINGTGDQLVTGTTTPNAGRLLNVKVNKASGKMILKNIICVMGNFTYVRGEIDGATYNGTLSFVSGTRSISGSFSVYNLSINGGAGVSTNNIVATDSITVNGELLLQGYSYATTIINGGTINAKGNITVASLSTANNVQTGLIHICGTGNQTLTGSGTVNGGQLCNITVNKPSGTLTLASIITFKSGTWKYIKGTVDPGTSSFYSMGSTINCGTSPATMPFYDFRVYGGTTTLTGALHVKRTLTIDASQTLTANSYEVLIGGNWVNNGTFAMGTGTVTFNGSGFQTLFRSSGNESFYTMKMNKASGKLIFNSPVTINAGLNLVKGVVVTTGTNSLAFTDNATTSGGSNLSYVHGPIRKTGDDAFVFPTGDTTLPDTSTYHPFGMSAPAGVTSSFSVKYYPYNQLIDHPTFTNIQGSLKKISTCEYWSLVRNAGTAAILPTVSWNRNSCNVSVLNEMRVAGWDGSQWKNMGQAVITGDSLQGTITAVGAALNLATVYYTTANVPHALVIDTRGVDSLTLPDTLKYTLNGSGLSGTYVAGGLQNVYPDLPTSGTTTPLVITFQVYGQSIQLGIDITSTGAVKNPHIIVPSNPSEPPCSIFGCLELENGLKVNDCLLKNCFKLSTTVYAILRRELDGGYFQIINGDFRFRFQEEYNDTDGKLTFRLYNGHHKLLLNTSNLPANARKNAAYGTTYYSINLLGCYDNQPFGAGYYTIEVENEKKEIWMARLKNVTKGPQPACQSIPIGD